MSNNAKLLGDRILRAIDSEITRHMGQISNPILRETIQETLRDSASEKVLAALSSTPPKALDISLAVREAMDELAKSMRGVKGSLKSSFKSSGTSSDNGGKSGSGAKASPRPRPSTVDYGGKGGRGYGGK